MLTNRKMGLSTQWLLGLLHHYCGNHCTGSVRLWCLQPNCANVVHVIALSETVLLRPSLTLSIRNLTFTLWRGEFHGYYYITIQCRPLLSGSVYVDSLQGPSQVVQDSGEVYTLLMSTGIWINGQTCMHTTGQITQLLLQHKWASAEKIVPGHVVCCATSGNWLYCLTTCLSQDGGRVIIASTLSQQFTL